MEEFRESLLIAIATPIYAIVILAEIIFSKLHDFRLYSKGETAKNVYLMMLNMGLDVLLRGFCLWFLDFFYQHHFTEFVNPLLYWGVLIVVQDFLFYVLHLVDHYCRLFWAVHVTHHSSEEFNFTVGFRSSVFQPVYRFIYYIPLSLLGFKGIDIMFAYSATQIYGILIHTQTVGKLGWIEKVMVTPSHHRVHHGSNPKYLDKNMGMLLIIWDKIFGTFQEELDEEPVRYGLTTPPKIDNPVNLVFHEWKSIADDMKQPISFSTKLKYLFNKPGWSHDGSRLTSSQQRALEELTTVKNFQPSNFSKSNSVPSNTA